MRCGIAEHASKSCCAEPKVSFIDSVKCAVRLLVTFTTLLSYQQSTAELELQPREGLRAKDDVLVLPL